MKRTRPKRPDPADTVHETTATGASLGARAAAEKTPDHHADLDHYLLREFHQEFGADELAPASDLHRSAADLLALQAPAFEQLRAEYRALWDEMAIRTARLPEIDRIVDRALTHRDRYVAIEARLGIPWFVVAGIHNLEASRRFDRHLHNGDPLTARTVQVPAGRPPSGRPPFTWEESAEDALVFDGIAANHDWSVERIAYVFERFNGWGYRRNHPEVKSPYLWSFSNHYERGKYVGDGKWSPTAVSSQCGAMVFVRRLADKEADVQNALISGGSRPGGDRLTSRGTLAATGSPPWVGIAHGELGQRDYPGPRYNPRVVEYLKTTGIEDNNDETSWCSAFVNWCMVQAHVPGTNSAAARSWLDYGKSLDAPAPGCIVVLWRESPQSRKGHVGFFDGWDTGERVRLLGGNQGGGVEWDEVCVTTFPKERILGFRWPKNL